MDELKTIEVMKSLKDFDKLNYYVLRESKTFGLKGESKFKKYKLIVENSILEFKDDITLFKLSGRGILSEKGTFSAKSQNVEFNFDTINKTLETNYKDRKIILILLILFYFDFIKQYAIRAKKEMCENV